MFIEVIDGNVHTLIRKDTIVKATFIYPNQTLSLKTVDGMYYSLNDVFLSKEEAYHWLETELNKPDFIEIEGHNTRFIRITEIKNIEIARNNYPDEYYSIIINDKFTLLEHFLEEGEAVEWINKNFRIFS